MNTFFTIFFFKQLFQMVFLFISLIYVKITFGYIIELKITELIPRIEPKYDCLLKLFRSEYSVV